MPENERSIETGALPDPDRIRRVSPNASFTQDLGSELRKAAQQRMQSAARPNLSEVVVELRKLVQLLRRTLVPVSPPAAFVKELGDQLWAEGIQLDEARQQRWRWLMVGGVVGSAVSLAGVVTAVLLKKRSGHTQANKPLGVA